MFISDLNQYLLTKTVGADNDQTASVFEISRQRFPFVGELKNVPDTNNYVILRPTSYGKKQVTDDLKSETGGSRLESDFSVCSNFFKQVKFLTLIPVKLPRYLNRG